MTIRFVGNGVFLNLLIKLRCSKKVLDQSHVMFFDSHAHLQEYMKSDDIGRYQDELYDHGVKGILTVSYDRGSSLKAAEIIGSHEASESLRRADTQWDQSTAIFRACGIHPEHAGEEFPQELIKTESSFKKTFCAIGEIGLDYRDGMPPRELQQIRFEEQLELCMDLKLPAVIHSVHACDDTLRILKKFKGLRSVMHGFSYSAQAAKEFIKLGAYIGIGTRILDERARRLPETVREIPAESMLLETDMPFCRQYNARTSADNRAAAHAAILTDIAEAISAIKHIPGPRIAEITTENAERVLKG